MQAHCFGSTPVQLAHLCNFVPCDIAWAQLKESHVLSVFALREWGRNFNVSELCWTSGQYRAGLVNHHLPHKGKNCTTTYKSNDNTIMLAGSNLKLEIRLLDAAVTFRIGISNKET